MGTLELMPHLPELTSQEGEQWINAALAEAKALHQHDSRLYPLAGGPGALATARALHEAWRRWADNAEAILRRLGSSHRSVGGLEELRVGVGYARGLGGLPPQEALRRHGAMESAQAKLYTTEEARRELGIAPRR
jgi:hypothetical protein